MNTVGVLDLGFSSVLSIVNKECKLFNSYVVIMIKALFFQSKLTVGLCTAYNIITLTCSNQPISDVDLTAETVAAVKTYHTVRLFIFILSRASSPAIVKLTYTAQSPEFFQALSGQRV